MKFVFVIAIVLSTVLGNTQTKFTTSPKRPAPMPTVTRDSHVRELIANSQLRVYRIELGPGEATAVSPHSHDFLIVSIGDSEFELSGAVNSIPFTMKDSEVQVIKGRWPHRVVNKASRPLRLVEVDVVRGIAPERASCGLNASPCRESKFAFNDQDKYVTGTLFETPSIKLSKVEIDPQSGMAEHGHTGDHVMIALTDQFVASAVIGGRIEDFDAKAGDAAWQTGGMVHRLINRGGQKALFLTIECK
ncbi:MAG TPA: hypothetical protein VN577_15685 [Terriglobales bacterium]|nr:hypothetical protein [Terriglobales bacterium]